MGAARGQGGLSGSQGLARAQVRRISANVRAVGGVAIAVIAAPAVCEPYASGGSTLRCHKVGAAAWKS